MAMQTNCGLSLQINYDLSTNNILENNKEDEENILKKIPARFASENRYSLEDIALSAIALEEALNLTNETFSEKQSWSLSKEPVIALIPPKKRYILEVEIVGIRKATPYIFDPE